MAELNGIPLITRTQWGARSPRDVVALPVEDASGVAVHYSASGADMGIDHSKCASRVLGIQRFHMSPSSSDPTKPWADIAYSHLFCQHGYLFRGRGIGVRTAANGTNDANDRFYAICFLGADRAGRRDITPAARIALLHYLVWMNVQIPGPMQVCPHSRFRSTSCPGDELRALLAATGWVCK